MSDRIAGFSGGQAGSSGNDSGFGLGRPPAFYSRNLRHVLSVIGDDINKPIVNGMSILHLAIGHHDLSLVRELISRGAKFFPDDKGRMPSTLAALCGVNESMSNLVNNAEAKAIGLNISED